MNRLQLWTALSALVMIATFAQCGPEKPAQQQEPSQAASGPAKAAAAAKGQDPSAPDLGAINLGTKLADLFPTLAAAHQKGELIVLMPQDVLKPLRTQIEAKKLPLKVLNLNKYTPEYYANQLVQRLRKAGPGGMWFVFDNQDPKIVAPIREFFLEEHRVPFERTFETQTLVKVINELPDSDAPKKVHLAQHGKSAGATVTDIQFTPDGATMFVAVKYGLVTWRSTSSDATGTSIQMPIFRKGKRAGVFGAGESGLVGFTTHPEFASNRKVYLHYNHSTIEGERHAIVSEWHAKDDLTFADERVLLRIPQPRTDHNGGQLLFGPADGYLYITVGDGGEGKHTIGRAPAHTYRGKVLRIDVNTRTDGKEYGIPADNPCLSHAELPPETYAWGFRNPWRLSVAPDGRMLAGDIGENINEEITFVVAGSHHGWPYVEGEHKRNKWTLGEQPLQPTLVAYGRSAGMSVIGGHVYRGAAYPWLHGKYVFADYVSGRIWALDLPDATDRSLSMDDAVELGHWPILFSTFGVGPNGELFVGTNSGAIFRLEQPREGDQEPQAAPIEAMPDATVQAMFATEMAPASEGLDDASVVALGRELYSDASLSSNGQMSCATCHPLDNYGQDGLPRSKTLDGKPSRRNAPPTFNAHRQFAQLWDYRTATVEQVAIDKLLEEHGLGNAAGVLQAVRNNAGYVAAFEKAFAGTGEALTLEHVGQAIGAFVRRLTTRSRWDAYLEGEASALTDLEKRGFSTFVSVGCTSCHQFRGLGGSMPHRLGLLKLWEGDDYGHEHISKEPGHRNYFKVPGLLNIEKTGPYLHDGSVATLAEVVELMADVQLNRKLTKQQLDAMVAFLKALTGEPPAVLK